MNTVQLTCFITVAETLNFLKTAELLHISQPAVTKQIKTLEDELKVKLFHRTTRSVELTTEGIIFLNDAKNIMNITMQAEKRFAEHSEYDRQIFTIGTHEQSELSFLSEILHGMRLKFPNINPVCRVVSFQHLYQYLREGTIDAIIAFKKTGVQKQYGKFQEFTKIPVMCVVSKDHPFVHKEYIKEKELINQKLILFEPQKCTDEIGMIQNRLIGIKPSKDIMFCDSFDASLTLATAGYGIAVLPKLPSLNRQFLRYIPLKGAELLSYGVYYKSTVVNSMLKYFLRLCGEYYAE